VLEIASFGKSGEADMLASFVDCFSPCFFYHHSKSKIQSSGSFDEDSEYSSQRYVPALKGIVTELVSNTLSMDDYPSVVPMPDLPSSSKSAASSARRRGKAAEGSSRKKKGATSQWSRSGNAEPVASSGGNYVGNRNLVFMVGGISYSELRVAREVMEKESRELVVGSTAFLSPGDFIDELSSLSSN
jgi:syntaxin-binding protein 1